MRHEPPAADWPQLWRDSYSYDLQEIYGQISHRGYTYAYRNRQRETIELVTAVLARGSRVLDVAAAQGNFSLTLAEMGYRVTWNDLRADLAGYVKLKHEGGEIEYLSGNVFDLVAPTPFDAVLITEVIEHVAHPDQFLQKAATLVKPGGYVIMTTPNGRYFRNTLPKFSECEDASRYEAVQFKPNADGHIFLLHPSEVSDLAVRAGLEIDGFTLFTNPLTCGHMKSEALLRILPERAVALFERASRRLPRGLRHVCLVHMAVRFRRLAA